MMSSNGQPDIEFFWDPMCPWAWLTSRWVCEVAKHIDLTVHWKFISLRLLNESLDYTTAFPPRYIAGHGSGLKLLRVAAAVRAEEGESPIGDLYTTFGSDIHVHRRLKELTDHWENGFPDYLRSAGVAERYIAEANNAEWDELLRAEKDEALRRTGSDVGTPILTYYRDGTQQSFFGPVISEVPRGERAIALWNAVWELATFPGFAELKRSLRAAPNLATSL